MLIEQAPARGARFGRGKRALPPRAADTAAPILRRESLYRTAATAGQRPTARIGGASVAAAARKPAGQATGPGAAREAPSTAGNDRGCQVAGGARRRRRAAKKRSAAREEVRCTATRIGRARARLAETSGHRPKTSAGGGPRSQRFRGLASGPAAAHDWPLTSRPRRGRAATRNVPAAWSLFQEPHEIPTLLPRRQLR